MGFACHVEKHVSNSSYKPRQPDKSALYQIVKEHMNTLFAEAEQTSGTGFGYPAYVKQEFEGYLRCGQFCCGFARLKCSCGYERLVPFSCKSRAVCSSCVSRRMAEQAAFLTDEVFPKAPYRQWTISFPKQIRFMMVRDDKLHSKVVTTFLRTIFAWQKRKAKKFGIKEPLVGSVTLLQRYGSLLQLTPHAHAWLPDGVFYKDRDGKMQFQWLPPPTQKEVEVLLAKVQGRILQICDKELSEPDEDQLALAVAQGEAIERKQRWDIDEPRLREMPALCAYGMGFSLHAGLFVGSNERKKLEKLMRYGMRPAIANKRLSITPDGKVLLKLRKSYYTGQTQVQFEPVAFLRRLAAIIPPRRQNQIRFHGIFAPNSKFNAAVKKLVPKKPQLVGKSNDTDAPKQKQDLETTDNKKRGYRLLWSELLLRVFKQDVLACPNCGDRLKLVALIKEPTAIKKICQHLGLPTQLPKPFPARPPPQLEGWG